MRRGVGIVILELGLDVEIGVEVEPVFELEVDSEGTGGRGVAVIAEDMVFEERKAWWVGWLVGWLRQKQGRVEL
jgi:hypothetical protein